MAEFCNCGSLVVRGNCTNKNCGDHHKSLVDPVTYAQVEYIKALQNQTGDQREIDFDILSKIEASRLIEELLTIKENGE